MSISSISGSNPFSLADLGGSGGVNANSATISFSNAPPRPPHGGGGGGSFVDAIKDVLAALSTDAATSTTATMSYSSDATSTMNVDSALDSFLQNLFAALRSESTASTTTSDGSDAQSDSSASAVAAATATATTAAANRPPPPPPPNSGAVPGLGHLESDLSKLVQSLSSTESGSSSTDTADTTATTIAAASSSSTTNSGLESSFENLLSALGDSGGTTLSSFLQTIATKLHATPSSGNIVNTTA